MNQGPRCVVLMKKNGGEKSHATVPLKHNIQLFFLTFSEASAYARSKMYNKNVKNKQFLLTL